MGDIIKEHKRIRHLTEIVITPEHVERTESKEFRESKERLKADGHYKCYVCQSTENLQIHHYACEWSLEDDVDFEKLKQFCEDWDPYGYGRLLKNQPITTVDDIRNLLVLCEHHHIKAVNGIHETSFPVWIIQKLAKSGTEPVPDDGDDVPDESQIGTEP